MRRFVVATTVALTSSWSSLSAAATPEEGALAEALFQEGKREMDAQRFHEACPKLAESHRLDPQGGTILTLALCHESEGKTASAWTELSEAISFAKRDGRPNREAIAREHLEVLEKRLVRLRIEVAPGTAHADGVHVRRDGIELKPAVWSLAAPVDPGTHVVEADAPGFVGFHTTVNVAAEGTTVVVAVPELTRQTESAVPWTAPTPAETTSPSTLRWSAVGAAGVALVALGLGTYFALDAKSQRDHANDLCPGTQCSNADAVSASRDAGRAADFATGAFVVGGVALAAATTLWLFSLRDGRAATSAR